MTLNKNITVVDDHLDEESLPIWFWGTETELQAQQGALKQARNLARHPLVCERVCLMPDTHQGYGMPIGGVVATREGVIPYAIGTDIGCGVISLKLDVEASSLSRDQLQQIRLKIHERVPVGEKSQTEVQAFPDELTHASIDLFDRMDGATCIVKSNLQTAEYQLGTLGGGNHFIELQADDENYLRVMIHSGSRKLGARICEAYHKQARHLNEMFFSACPPSDPKRELAFIPKGIPLYKLYLAEMEWAMTFAEMNRAGMLEATLAAINAVLGYNVETLGEYIETHHNYAQMEHWLGKDYLVHRKGAVAARGLINLPGSMGTASYICEGKDNQLAFGSAAHGAGRVMSRAEANRTITHAEAVKQVEHVVFGVREGDYDEMPAAYKDISRVVEAQSDLATPVIKLLPLAVVKG